MRGGGDGGDDPKTPKLKLDDRGVDIKTPKPH